MTAVRNEKIVLGLDPGTYITGYGLLQLEGTEVGLLRFGVIQTGKKLSHELRLKEIFEEVIALIEEFHPDEVALEAPFFGKNVQSMLKLGRAQGVAIAAALSKEIAVIEYAPRKVKQSVTGNGNASKEQVAETLRHILKFKHTPKLLDATDGLAVALCHCFQGGKHKSKIKSWKSFMKENPGRVAE